MQFYAMLPTPQTTDYNTGLSPEAKAAKLERYKDRGIVPSCTYQLRQLAVDGMMPTPITSDSQGGARKIEANGRTLRRSSGENFSASLKGIMITRSESGGVTFRLSPLFTQEMMGFPFGWTELPFLSENGEQKP
jgi:hypothetical protein